MNLVDTDQLKIEYLRRGNEIYLPHISLEQLLLAKTVEAIPIDKPFLKMKYKGYTVYNSDWLKEHIDMEYHVIKGDSESKAEAIPIAWVKRWAMKSENTYNREQIVEMLNDWEKENG